MTKIQKITPFLWFDRTAEEAVNYYLSIFDHSSIRQINRNGGVATVIDFELGGQRFNAMNFETQFRFNSFTSFYVTCETEAETESVWNKLLEGGKIWIPLQKFDWSDKYGFLEDKFGVSWQIALGKMADTGQKFTPCLLFTGPQKGRGEAAVHLYTGIFGESSIKNILHYGAGEEGPEGTVRHAQFQLAGQTFMIMDNPTDQDFSFTEAISFMVNCEGQQEVDFYWDKLTADGGEEGRCGWLKDKFGLSWQIVPQILPELLNHPDPAVAQKAMQAMMQMNKIEIDQLTGNSPQAKTLITIETAVDAPVEQVWKLWNEAAHVVKWNHASDDWHTPKAENDFRKGGNFVYTMAAKDGSFSFDFGGIYDEIIENQSVAYTLGDDRKVEIKFRANGDKTEIVESFEAESTNPVDMQRAGWQSILDNFKKYAEEYV